MRSMRWVVGSTPHGAWLGTLERDRLSHFVKRLRSGMTVWDIGANVGLYSLPAARAVGKSGRVYAFEPLIRNLSYLRQHIALNKLMNVVIVDAAVSDRSRMVRMAEGDSPSEFHIASSGDFEVRAVALDEWRVDINCPPPNLVKIDVEGAEVLVLQGGAETFRRWRPPIYLSLHGEQQRCECAALLEGWGYQVLSVEGSPSESSEWLAESMSCSEY